MQAWLESGEVDVALLYGGPLPAHFHVEPLVEEDLWVVGSPADGFRRDQPVPLRLLEGRPLAVPAYLHGSRSLLEQASATLRVELNFAVETNSFGVQKRLAMNGTCITVLAALAVTDEVEKGLASAAPLCEPRITRTIVLAHSLSRPLSPYVQCVLECLKDCMRAAIASGRWPEARWIGSGA